MCTSYFHLNYTFDYTPHILNMCNNERPYCSPQHVQSFVNDTWMERYAAPVDASTSMLIWSFVVSVFSLGAWAGAVHSGSLPVTYGR